MDYGREVFAIPGSIHNPLARGCHWLIRHGAKLVEEAADILVELEPQLRAEGIASPHRRRDRAKARESSPLRAIPATETC